MPTHSQHGRRHFLRLAAGFSAGAMLTGCGGGAPAVEAAPAVATAVKTGAVAAVEHPLNLALNLAYLGAQYYGYAARGAGLPATLTNGVGQFDAAYGAREAVFADPVIARHAAELADDKQAHVVALRNEMGALAAAQPRLDLSATSTGAFSLAAQGAGIVAPGTVFDPYADDVSFLLGAFLIEDAVAAAYRARLALDADTTSSSVLSANLADSIYHGGLIRSLLDERATIDTSIASALASASALLAAIDGTNVGDQSLSGAIGDSSNLFDSAGRPIPFTRTNAQVLKVLYLSNNSVGGFLPAGANGVPA